MARYSEAIAHALGLPAGTVALVRTAATLHDVGKYLVPHAILVKPGPLTDEERAIVRRHPVDGAALLEGVVDDEAVDMIRSHHERLDGSGYPAGLAGAEIPLGARIIAVADSFDAMTSPRPYRAPVSRLTALAELRDQAGSLYEEAAVLGLDEIARGIDGPAVRDLRQPLVELPPVGPLLA